MAGIRRKELRNILDPEDADLLAFPGWTNHSEGYVRRQVRTIPGSDRGRIWVHMSRVVLERSIGRQLASGELADHINGCVYDNRRCNLRVATIQTNGRNRKLHKANKTGFRGVTVIGQRYIAAIFTQGQRIYLGSFSEVENASAAYNAAAEILFGEFARKD